MSTPLCAPIMHSSKGAEYFDLKKMDVTLDQSLLDAAAAKTRAKEVDSITLTSPALGAIPLMQWKMDLVCKVAASTPHTHLATKWMMQIDHASSWEELIDPEPLQQLGLKLGSAVMEILPSDLKRRAHVEHHSYMLRTGK